MALDHTTKEPKGAAYGRFEYIEDRTSMMQKWADYLYALRSGESTDQYVHNSPSKKPANKLQALIDKLDGDKVLIILHKRYS